ncbi:MAG: hypothetical protein R3F11_27420 [Verrucomicrobiales bacterium]
MFLLFIYLASPASQFRRLSAVAAKAMSNGTAAKTKTMNFRERITWKYAASFSRRKREVVRMTEPA